MHVKLFSSTKCQVFKTSNSTERKITQYLISKINNIAWYHFLSVNSNKLSTTKHNTPATFTDLSIFYMNGINYASSSSETESLKWIHVLKIDTSEFKQVCALLVNHKQSRHHHIGREAASQWILKQQSVYEPRQLQKKSHCGWQKRRI